MGWVLSDDLGWSREGGQGSQSEALVHLLARGGGVLWLWLPLQHLRSQAPLESAEKTCGDIYSQNLHPHKGRQGLGLGGGGRGQTF